VSLSLVLLITYSVLMVAVGLWIGTRVHAASDFFVAGRKLGPGLLFSTFLAANIGAGSTVGATSNAFRDGLSAWWWNGSAGLGSLALAFWIGPRIWREAIAHGDYTVGDFLERHYGRAMRGLVAVLIWIGTYYVLAGQLVGIAAVLLVAGDVPPAIGMVLGSLVTTSYFVAGGLLSSAWVNRIQLLVIIAGFATVTPIALSLAGGWDVLSARGGAALNLLGTGAADSGWHHLVLLGPAFIVSPGLLQKAFGARDERALTLGVGLNGAALLLFACAPALIGTSASVLHPELENADLALATVMTQTLHPAFGSLALAAVFSAEVSSADAVLFMLATSASRDIYRGFVKPSATDAELLRIARMTAIMAGVIGVLVALVQSSVLGALRSFYSLLTVTLFVPVIGALYVPRSGRAEGVSSVIAGVATLFTVQISTDGAGIGFISPTLAGVLASAGAFGAVRLACLRSPV
jgi:SSS family solute:Na+ symporter